MWTGRKLITFIGPIWHEHKYPYLYNSTSIDDITMTSSGVVFRLNKAPPEPQNNVLELFPQCGYFLILTSLEWWWTCAIKRQKMFRRRRRQFYRLGSAAKVWPVLRHLRWNSPQTTLQHHSTACTCVLHLCLPHFMVETYSRLKFSPDKISRRVQALF